MKTRYRDHIPALLAGAAALCTVAACTSPTPAPVARQADAPLAVAANPAGPDDTSAPLTPKQNMPCHFDSTGLQQLRKGGNRKPIRVTYGVDAQGRTEQIVVDTSSGDARLDEAAFDAVQHGTCAPYLVDGVPHRIVQHTFFVAFPPPGAPLGLNPAPGFGVAGRRPTPADPMNDPPRRGPAIASDFDRADPAASNGTSPAVIEVAPAPGGTAQAMTLDQLGVEPGSARAAQMVRWAIRIHNDPEVSRYFGNGPDHTNLSQLTPLMRTGFFAEASLRLTPEQRTAFLELNMRTLDHAPRDCGGLKNAGQVSARYISINTMSDAEFDRFMNLMVAMLRQTTRQAPLASVTETERIEAAQHVLTATQLLVNDSRSAAINTAMVAAHPETASPEAWCNSLRIMNRALLNTPEPYRDWAMVAGSQGMAARVSVQQHFGMGDSAH